MNPDTNYAVDVYLDIEAWVRDRIEGYSEIVV